MPSASFTSSRSYVRRSKRKGANRIALPNRPVGKYCYYFIFYDHKGLIFIFFKYFA